MKFTDPNIHKELARMRAENPEATHMFLYSAQQTQWLVGLLPKHTNAIFKGVPYSEYRRIYHGLDSEYDDIELLGVGTEGDITPTTK
jgi:hypothetical protein